MTNSKSWNQRIIVKSCIILSLIVLITISQFGCEKFGTTILLNEVRMSPGKFSIITRITRLGLFTKNQSFFNSIWLYQSFPFFIGNRVGLTCNEVSNLYDIAKLRNVLLLRFVIKIRSGRLLGYALQCSIKANRRNFFKTMRTKCGKCTKKESKRLWGLSFLDKPKIKVKLFGSKLLQNCEEIKKLPIKYGNRFL